MGGTGSWNHWDFAYHHSLQFERSHSILARNAAGKLDEPTLKEIASMIESAQKLRVMIESQRP